MPFNPDQSSSVPSPAPTAAPKGQVRRVHVVASEHLSGLSEDAEEEEVIYFGVRHKRMDDHVLCHWDR